MFEIAKTSPAPLTEQIVEYYAQRIEQGAMAAGTRLPSVRQLASRLGISAHTVLGGYERLVGLGLVQARTGAGYFVASRAKSEASAEAEPGWPSPSSSEGFAHSVLAGHHGLLQAGSGFLPPGWFDDAIPPSTIARCLRESASNGSIAPTQGLLALRTQVADRLARRQIAATPGHIMTSYGASQALHLVARCVAGPGDVVLVDDPGYFFLYSQLEALGVRLVSIPRFEDGPDIEALERAVAEYRPKAFFTQTLLHNPTGGNTSPAKCHRLLVLAEANDFHLVEDDAYGELAGDHHVRLAQIGGLKRVIYIGSFAKVLNPGLRVGYVAASAAMIERLIDLKLTSVLSGSGVEETIVAEVLASGRFNRHIRRLAERLSKARSATTEMLGSLGFEVSPLHAEGLFLWCSVPAGVDVDHLTAAARDAGIVLANGAMFSRTGGSRDRLRFNPGCCTDPRLAAFLRAYLAASLPTKLAKRLT